MIALFSLDAHFIEWMRMIDKDQLEDRMTIIDPVMFSEPGTSLAGTGE